MTRPWMIGLVGALVAASFAIGVATRPSRAPVLARERARAAEARDGEAPLRDRGRAAPGRVGALPSTLPSSDPVREALATGQTVVEAYDAQGRDAAWAAPVERFIDGEYAAMLPTLIPNAVGLKVECKTSLCKVSFEVPEADTRGAMWRTQHMTIADGVSPYAEEANSAGAMRIVAYARFAPASREVDVLTAHWRDEMGARFPGGLSQMRSFLDDEERRLAALAAGRP